jgi:hypothetical protein
MAEELLVHTEGDAFIADMGYDADRIRANVRKAWDEARHPFEPEPQASAAFRPTPFKVLGAYRSLGHVGLHESPRPRFSASHEQAFRVLVS